MMVGCTELKKMVKVKFKLRAHPSAVTAGKPDFGVVQLYQNNYDLNSNFPPKLK